MGNRGILHDAERRILRDWQVRRWIACRLEFRGRHRAVMTPGSYTELFFLDEAAALADGHRPCAECRHADYVAFHNAWRSVSATSAASAGAMDAVLHRERREGPYRKRMYVSQLNGLPDGTYVELDEQAWLVLADALFAWSPERYMERRERPSAEVRVLTPASIVSVLRAGYRASLHPSAGM